MSLFDLLELDKPCNRRKYFRQPPPKKVIEHVDHYWEVVGGQDKGGIVVRAGEEPNSEKKEQRLGYGARIRDLDTAGNRMEYVKLAGDGPDRGWISMCTREKELLQKVEVVFREEEEDDEPKFAEDDDEHESGTGLMYEVVAERVKVRAAPSLQARVIRGYWKHQEVEMFDWDETQKWREVYVKYIGRGWMMLDKDGPLLRPKGIPFQEKPLNPVAVAAMEDNTEHLSAFIEKRLDVNSIDDLGITPLMLAAQADNPNCVLLLMRAGASASTKSKDGKTAVELAERTAPVTQALLLALTLRDFDLSLCEEACSRIIPELQPLARTKLQVPLRMQQEREEERRRQDEEHAAQVPASGTVQDTRERYRVTGRICVVRADPSIRADVVCNKKMGEIVTALERDSSGRWVKIDCPYIDRRTKAEHHHAWMMVEHRDQGQVLTLLSDSN